MRVLCQARAGSFLLCVRANESSGPNSESGRAKIEDPTTRTRVLAVQEALFCSRVLLATPDCSDCNNNAKERRKNDHRRASLPQQANRVRLATRDAHDFIMYFCEPTRRAEVVLRQLGWLGPDASVLAGLRRRRLMMESARGGIAKMNGPSATNHLRAAPIRRAPIMIVVVVFV